MGCRPSPAAPSCFWAIASGLLVTVAASSACSTATATKVATVPPPLSADEASVPAPPAPTVDYTTAPRPDGVVGGVRAALLAKQIAAALRARGEEGQADG